MHWKVKKIYSDYFNKRYKFFNSKGKKRGINVAEITGLGVVVRTDISNIIILKQVGKD